MTNSNPTTGLLAGAAGRILVYECALAAVLALAGLLSPVLGFLPFAWVVLVAVAGGFLAAAWWVYPSQVDERRAFVLANALAAFTVVRTLIDGMTFQQYTMPLIWMLAVIFVFWLVWDGRAGRGLRFPVPVLLVLGFLVVALVTSRWSYQQDATFRTLLAWWGYLMVFLLASQALRTPLSRGIVLGTLLLLTFGESIYAVLHVKYLLPVTREMLRLNPDMLGTHLGQAELSPQLAHRLYSNRAFGSFLFPNALAAFCILGAGVASGALMNGVAALRRLPKTRPEGPDERPEIVAAALWFISLSACFLAFYFYFYKIRYVGLATAGLAPVSWTEHPVQWFVAVGVVPAAIAAAGWAVVNRGGTPSLLRWTQTILASAALLAALVALVFSFSRGGALSLGVAASVTAAMLVWKGRRPHTGGRVAALVLLGAGFVLTLAATAQPVAEPQPGPQTEQVPEHNAPPPEAGFPRRVGGFYTSFADLLSPATLGLRVGYWQVALRMAADNPLTGVGLGNFGTAYPKYQFLGAGDVKQAHNDYLQALTETGLAGFGLFTAFWGYFAVVGAMRVRREDRLPQRLLLAGLYGGVLAFAIHATLDFNFSNPSLASLAFLGAGLFYASVRDDHAPGLPAGRPPVRRFAIYVPLLVLTLVAVLGAARVYRIDRGVADWAQANTRMAAASQLLQAGAATGAGSSALARLPYRNAFALIPDAQLLDEIGDIMVPRDLTGRDLRPRGANEPLRGTEVFVVRDRERAFEYARRAVDRWLHLLQEADQQYPFSPDVAARMYNWYDLLQRFERSPDALDEIVKRKVGWASRLVERSPQQAVNHQFLGDAFWNRAGTLAGQEQLNAYEASLAAYRRATELYPINPDVWRLYGQRSVDFGEALVRAGREEGGQALVDEGRAALDRADELPERR